MAGLPSLYAMSTSIVPSTCPTSIPSIPINASYPTSGNESLPSLPDSFGSTLTPCATPSAPSVSSLQLNMTDYGAQYPTGTGAPTGCSGTPESIVNLQGGCPEPPDGWFGEDHGTHRGGGEDDRSEWVGTATKYAAAGLLGMYATYKGATEAMGCIKRKITKHVTDGVTSFKDFMDDQVGSVKQSAIGYAETAGAWLLLAGAARVTAKMIQQSHAAASTEVPLSHIRPTGYEASGRSFIVSADRFPTLVTAAVPQSNWDKLTGAKSGLGGGSYWGKLSNLVSLGGNSGKSGESGSITGKASDIDTFWKRVVHVP